MANGEGQRPLHFAATPHVVQVLVAFKANVNTRCKKSGWTPLHVHVQAGRKVDVVTELLRHGADIEAKDNNGIAVSLLLRR